MTSFGLRSKEYYQNSFNIFLAKTGERSKNVKRLREHLPPLIQKLVPGLEDRSSFNVLSVGAGTGEMDIEIMKIVHSELQKSELGSPLKIYNRGIEPNEYSCHLYRAAMENLPSPLYQQAETELHQQTFEEYRESQKDKEESVKFDLVHFIQSIYYVDIEQAVVHCVEKEIGEHGVFVCIVADKGLTYWVTLKQPIKWHGEDTPDKKLNETAEEIAMIADKHGWKHEIHTNEYTNGIDVTEVFDEKSTEGNLLLDFLTHTVNFRETADKQLVEETLALIKELSTMKDGKRIGEKRESILLIYK